MWGTSNARNKVALQVDAMSPKLLDNVFLSQEPRRGSEVSAWSVGRGESVALTEEDRESSEINEIFNSVIWKCRSLFHYRSTCRCRSACPRRSTY